MIQHSKAIESRVLTDSEILARGIELMKEFHASRLNLLVARFADENYSIDHLRRFRKQVEDELGDETELILEQTGKGRNDRSYWYYYIRFSRFSKTDRPVKTVFSFDGRGRVYRFIVQAQPEEAPTRFKDYRTKTNLRLPFRGEWFVTAGGRDIVHNHHAISVDQRFAYDFLIRREGFTYRNDGASNEDYFCFGEEILAPGSGVIVDVINDIPENNPGEMPDNSGNRVIIDHGNGEFSVLAHFKQHSIEVDPGDEVVAGQRLGLCGNSGRSSEAHLHYHLQNAPVMFKGEGLPAQFTGYLADGKPVDRGEPLIGQQIQPICEDGR